MRAALSLLAVAVFACWTTGCSNSSTDAPAAEQAETPAATADSSSSSSAHADDAVADEEPQPPSEDEVYEKLRELYSSRKFDEAETQFAAALQAFPDSRNINSLHDFAATCLLRVGRKAEAYQHLSNCADFMMKRAAKHRGVARSFPSQLWRLARLADELDGPPTADEVFDDYAARAADLSPPAPYLARAISIGRASRWAETERLGEARALVDDVQSAATKTLEATPDDVDAINSVADVLEHREFMEIAAGDDGDSDAARTAYLDFLFAQATSHPRENSLRRRFADEHASAASNLAYSDPEAANTLLDRIDAYETHAIIPLNDEKLLSEWRGQMPGGEPLAQIREAIEQSRKRFALIGTPAQFPDNADGWVGVDAALASDQLRGKVVLLDFFAVWCGPCIATFPHLRAWHDEFSPQGLQVIGVTNYQSFNWDAEAGRSKRVADLEPAAERAGMEQFAAHHELPYAIAFTPDRELQTHYVVSGIPHVVLIDRAGKVRLFRIGSGEQNAADMEQAIRECLAEAPAAEVNAIESDDAEPTDAAAPPPTEPAAAESAG